MNQRVFEIPPGFEKRLNNLYLGTDDGQIDFLRDVPGVGCYETVCAASVQATSQAGTYRILNIDNLIAAKEALSRERDRAAALQLRSIRDAAIPKTKSS